jgi:bifunctional non-homologous end joining protein LigD
MPESRAKARFVEPMLLLRTERLPEGENWLYEIKLDGYRALAIKSGGKLHLRSRNDNDFNSRYPQIAKAPIPAAYSGEGDHDSELMPITIPGPTDF